MEKKLIVAVVVWLMLVSHLSLPVWADFYVDSPINMGPVINAGNRTGVDCISYDGDELFAFSTVGGPILRLYTSKLQSDGTWGPLEKIDADWNVPSGMRTGACISPDGSELYFTQWAGNNAAIWSTRRISKDAPWEQPEKLGSHINRGSITDSAWISPTGLEMHFTSNAPGGHGGYDVYITRRDTVDSEWGTPENVGAPVSSKFDESLISISSDELALFVGGWENMNERRVHGGVDMFVSLRKSTDDPWQEPKGLGRLVNTQGFESNPRISPDGKTLYFVSNDQTATQPYDAYQAQLVPLVDFNLDGTVEIEDLVGLINYWGQSNPRFDIGPMPWGDGIVGRADLEVLLSYWGQEVYDPSLLAHWALDEVDGLFAEENVSGNMDIVLGNPTWQPEGGQVRGCLEFDGVDDMVILKPVLDPANDSFSLFAWIKGGGPGQVILSQQSGVNWLKVDTDGTLMTELTRSGGRSPGSPLYSDAMITDGNWHRIGFVCDGIQRILYVDDIPVAIDDQANLGGSTGGLVIGVGTDNQAGTFWSGMIDDVRIYNRAVAP